MKGVPAGGKVSRALEVADAEVKAATRRVAERAAKFAKRRKFGQAEQALQVARGVDAFRLQLRALRKQWRAAGGRPSSSRESDRTPLWSYYMPLARMIARLGGDAAAIDLEAALAEQVDALFKAGDLETTTSGEPRWKMMVRRARRPMVREGYLVSKGSRWKLTDEGLRLSREAEAGTASP